MKRRPKSRVPMWVREMRPGWVRSYLLAVFLPLKRSDQEEMRTW